ncbi:unnamed protein product [Effrenium voratum]|nr:unnamed protein product [Effrenium voratum]
MEKAKAQESFVEEDSDVIQIARKTLHMLEAEENMAKTRAEVAEELSKAVQAEDQRRLLAAITAADAAGFTSSEAEIGAAFCRSPLPGKGSDACEPELALP